MEVADILAARSVSICAEPLSKHALFEHLAGAASAASGCDRDIALSALLERESLGSTGLGNGIAVPHGKVPALGSVTAAFARLDVPVDFDAVDDQPVDLVMMLLAPVGAGADHLKALSRVARLLRTESVVEAIRHAPDADRIHALLTAPLETSNAA